MNQMPTRPLRIFLVAGEHSGDALGARLMMALTAQRPGVTFSQTRQATMRFKPMSVLAVAAITAAKERSV